MDDDLLAQFAQIQRYAAGLQGLLAEAQAVAPQHSEGTDKSGAIRVRLGPDGIPTSFSVSGDWARRLEPAAFGPAVVEACEAAIGHRLEEWTGSLDEDDWQDKVERLKGGPNDTTAPPREPGRIPPALRQAVEEAEPRRLDLLAEEMIAAFDNVESFVPPPVEPASGSIGKLTITLSSTGLTSCTAESRWVSGQSAAGLMNALSAALTQARTDLENGVTDEEPATGLDRLLAQTLSLLNSPDRLRDS